MSTDQVYNGKSGHLEKFINPINYYGTSKFEERNILRFTFSYP